MSDTTTSTALRGDSRKTFFPALIAVLAASLLLLALPGRAEAHGESINVSPTEAGAGDTIAITGTGFPVGEEVDLMLEGIRGTVELTHAEVGEDGTFSITVSIPTTTASGSYQLVGVTADDNIALDFKVIEGTAPSGGGGTTNLTFERSDLEVIVVGLMALALVAGGAFLVYSSKRRTA